MLSLVWLTSLALMCASMSVLAALIIARLHRDHVERVRLTLRPKLARALMRFAAGQQEAPKIRIERRVEREALVETALDTVQLMQGGTKERLVAYLRALGIDAILRRQALCRNVRKRVQALEALSLFPGEKTIDVLQRAEASRDLRVWLTALRARCALGVGPDIAGLIEASERTGARRSSAMQELIAERVRTHLNEALAALRTPLQPLTRALLVRALGETGSRHALDPLRLALHNPDPAVRAAAAGGLGALGFDGAADALARATRDSDWRVRLRAAEAIGQLHLWRQAEHLTPLLSDPVWWVRYRAEEALKRLGDLGVKQLARASGPTRPDA
ncbi:MAG: HEAT repeat domain-containing protein [Hyphomonadaceae bacterium]|nr:HEAT repeat domain-containing protein [Hyphomonadaceae bacterium]